MDLILEKLIKLLNLYQTGKLGGELMPEDSNPNLLKSSEENLIYFTLPMALNYQRNSYTLWQNALKTYQDPDTAFLFNPKKVANTDIEIVRQAMLKYQLALQPVKHIEIWTTLCNTIANTLNGKLSNLFLNCNYDILKIKAYIMSNKKDFPYLGGTKILNYWLYVLTNYTSLKLTNIDNITIAPDTHIIQSSVKLNIITSHDLERSDIRDLVASRFNEILKGTSYAPITFHTPLWLWSRNHFKPEV